MSLHLIAATASYDMRFIYDTRISLRRLRRSTCRLIDIIDIFLFRYMPLYYYNLNASPQGFADDFACRRHNIIAIYFAIYYYYFHFHFYLFRFTILDSIMRRLKSLRIAKRVSNYDNSRDDFESAKF